MRILTTGSREWTDVNTIHAALSEFYVGYSKVTLVSGGCPRGADIICENYGYWAGWDVEIHPAKWDEYGKSAGYVRNSEMVKLGADVCFAFILNHSKGATNTAALAMTAGIETRIYHVQDF